MAIINVKLEKQLLTIQNREIIAAGDVEVDKCQFQCDKTWNDYVKTAVFYQNKDSVHYVLLDKDDKCTVPAGAMAKKGKMFIGLFGSKRAEILTSTVDTIEILEGAISGAEISTEPSDDIFLAIIAQYQSIAAQMERYHQIAEEIDEKYAEQNEILSKLNAWDVLDVSMRMNAVEERVTEYRVLAETIQNREILLRNQPIVFNSQGICEIENGYVTENSICDVYFDEYSYELAAASFITVTSHNGFMRLTSAKRVEDELNANILIRRY